MKSGLSLKEHPVHLGLGATATDQPAFTGDMSWYMDYASRHAGDGAEGRLVALHTFTDAWTSWEMHPLGSELVLCVAGEIILHQEDEDGCASSLRLEAGQYAVNAPGVWHTADVEESATVLFITAGKETQHRPR